MLVSELSRRKLRVGSAPCFGIFRPRVLPLLYGSYRIP